MPNSQAPPPSLDPLTIMTVVVGLGFLLVIGRAVWTGDLNKDLLSTLATIIGALIAAHSTRKAANKKGDDDDDQPA